MVPAKIPRIVGRLGSEPRLVGRLDQKYELVPVFEFSLRGNLREGNMLSVPPFVTLVNSVKTTNHIFIYL